MKDALLLLAYLLATLARLLRPGGTRAIAAENLLMRQQLVVIQRSRRRAPNLTTFDRILFGFWAQFLSPRRIACAAVIIRPSTLLRFHDALKRRKYRQLFTPRRRSKPGPKGPPQELIDAIVELKRRNPRFGCPRIALILAKTFGVEINKDVVRRVLAKHYRPESGGGGPSWLTFIGHMKDSLWSVDLFRCESVLLKRHWVLVVMDQCTRRIIGFGVQAGAVDGRALCRMFNHATLAGQAPPRYLSSDHDPLFGFQQWQANLRILGVEGIKSVPYLPRSHPFVERLVGTVRREYLDHVFFWTAVDLERKLDEFKEFYNRHRVHSSLGGDTPAAVGGSDATLRAELTNFRWQSHCGELYQLPLAA